MPQKNLDQIDENPLDTELDIDISQIDFDVPMTMLKNSSHHEDQNTLQQPHLTNLNNHGRNNSIDKLNKKIQIGASSKPKRKSSVDSVKVWKQIREKIPDFFREICTCENMGYCTCDEI